jgi:hypothetical protein
MLIVAPIGRLGEIAETPDAHIVSFHAPDAAALADLP